MFKSVGWTWNPIAGCTHDCKYCWAKSLTERWGKPFTPQLREHFLKDKMPNDASWIFVGSMGDIGCEGVSEEWREKLYDFIEQDKSNNTFLLQSKNPSVFTANRERLETIKHKIVLGTTLETTEETPWSVAPDTFSRAVSLSYMKHNHGYRAFLSLEPISDFDLELMTSWIDNIKPEAIEIGKENYTHYTTPPSDEKLLDLMTWLDKEGYEYILKDNLDYLQPKATLGDV